MLMELLFFRNSWNPRIQRISRIVVNFPEFKDFHSPISPIFKNVILQIPRIPQIPWFPRIPWILWIPQILQILQIWRTIFSNFQEINSEKKKFSTLPEFQELFFPVIQNSPKSVKSMNKILRIPQIPLIPSFPGFFCLTLHVFVDFDWMEPQIWFSFWPVSSWASWECFATQAAWLLWSVSIKSII